MKFDNTLESNRKYQATRCIWCGSAVLYYCPGNRVESAVSWTLRQQSRNYPCVEPHSSGALHLCLNISGISSTYNPLPVALSASEAEQLSALSRKEWASSDVPTAIECFSGFIYEEDMGVSPDLVLALKWNLNKARGTIFEGREIRLGMNEADKLSFLKVASEIAAELRVVAQKKPTKSKSYQRRV